MGLKIYFILKFHMLVLKIFYFCLYLAPRVEFSLASLMCTTLGDGTTTVELNISMAFEGGQWRILPKILRE